MKKIYWILSLSLILLSTISVPIIAKESKTENNTHLTDEFVRELKLAETEGDSLFYQKLIDMLITLAMLIFFIILFLWIAKRLLATRVQQVNLSRDIKVLEHRSISTKTTLYTIEVFGKKIAIAESINGITKLCEIFPTEKK